MHGITILCICSSTYNPTSVSAMLLANAAFILLQLVFVMWEMVMFPQWLCCLLF